jgi:hypothetical protein
VKARVRNIKLSRGDVRRLRIYRGKCGFRLVIFDEDTSVPLIQAKLSAAERHALRKALGPDK